MHPTSTVASLMTPVTSSPVQTQTAPPTHPLDCAAWTSLTGPHAHFAEGAGRARRYRAELSPFAAISSPDDEQAWADLHALYGDHRAVVLSGPPRFAQSLPRGWLVEETIPGVQLIATAAHRSQPDAEAFRIGPQDAAEAADLVARTEPGPFRPETYRLGTYLGIRRAGRLVALAGERLHPPGWSEISAVCTDPDLRRQGLATRLIRAVADQIRARGETPFLHTAANNTRAIDLYLALGYELRRQVDFVALRAPTVCRTGRERRQMLSEQESLRLFLVTGLLVTVGVAPLLVGSFSIHRWLRALPRLGWWAAVACICLFVTGLAGTRWTLSAAQWIGGVADEQWSSRAEGRGI